MLEVSEDRLSFNVERCRQAEMYGGRAARLAARSLPLAPLTGHAHTRAASLEPSMEVGVGNSPTRAHVFAIEA